METGSGGSRGLGILPVNRLLAEWMRGIRAVAGATHSYNEDS